MDGQRPIILTFLLHKKIKRYYKIYSTNIVGNFLKKKIIGNFKMT